MHCDCATLLCRGAKPFEVFFLMSWVACPAYWRHAPHIVFQDGPTGSQPPFEANQPCAPGRYCRATPSFSVLMNALPALQQIVLGKGDVSGGWGAADGIGDCEHRLYNVANRPAGRQEQALAEQAQQARGRAAGARSASACPAASLA